MQLDTGNALLIGGGLCVLCVVGVGLFFGLQVFVSIFEIAGTLFETITGFISGGPTLWCGCIVVLLVLGSCAVVVALTATALQGCGTADATNLCTLFGR